MWIPTSARDGGPLRGEDEEEAEAEEEDVGEAEGDSPSFNVQFSDTVPFVAGGG